MHHLRNRSLASLVAVAILSSWTGASAQPVESFGRNVPLAAAIPRIVPEGFSVRVEPESLEKTRISWASGQDWRQVLRRSVQQAGLRFREEGNVIIIEQQPRQQAAAQQATESSPRQQRQATSQSGARGLPGEDPAQQTAGFVLSQSGESVSGVQSGTPQSGVTRSTTTQTQQTQQTQENRHQQPPAGQRLSGAGQVSETSGVQAGRRSAEGSASNRIASGLWRAEKGHTLDQILADWAERAGWTLVFNTPVIYEMQAGVELRGDFIEAAASLINSIQARPLPRAVFYRGNRVLVVSNSFEGLTQ